MKITIVGTGYVGLVTGACLAELGHRVMCLDLDRAKVARLKQGQVAMHEPGLAELVVRNLAARRLQFTTDVALSVAHGTLQFITVGTPSDAGGGADLQQVLAAARHIGRHMTEFKVVVAKSTVPVGTGERIRAEIDAQLARDGRDGAIAFAVVSNPEFLREGAAVADFMRPDRIVLGCGNAAADLEARALMTALYAPFDRDRRCTLWMDVRSSELTKYAANAMLATRISLMNELAAMAAVVGADIESVRVGIGSDGRIGHAFLRPGCGYGGSCFPKDVRALVRSAGHFGCQMNILQAVEEVNRQQKEVLLGKVIGHFGEDLRGKCFALWGLAFKPGTSDMREAPSRTLIEGLVGRGASIAAYDPVAMPEAALAIAADIGGQAMAERVRFCISANQALQDAHALIIVTEWPCFRDADFTLIAQCLHTPLVFDGRNMFSLDEIAQAPLDYHSIGRQCMHGSRWTSNWPLLPGSLAHPMADTGSGLSLTRS
jgi:UDPglucose 6-dehydrogenase